MVHSVLQAIVRWLIYAKREVCHLYIYYKVVFKNAIMISFSTDKQ